MKKISYLLIMLIVLILPTFVRADMGAPTIRPYELIVVADEVTYYDDWEFKKELGTLKKGEIVKSFPYFNGDSEENGYIEYNGKQIYLKNLNGLMLNEDFIDPTKIDYSNDSIVKLSKPLNAIVNAKSGVKLRKGPSTIYDRITTIPKGTKLIVNYVVTDYEMGSEYYTHFYVEYNNQKGWINILDENVLYESSYEYIAVKDYNASCGIIPANTILKSKYQSDLWSRQAYIDYNGCEFSIYIWGDENYSIYASDKYYYKAEENLKIFKFANTKSEVLTTIDKGDTFISRADETDAEYLEDDDYRYSYVEYNGTTGWIYAQETSYTYLNKAKEEPSEPADEPVTNGVEITTSPEPTTKEKKEDKKTDTKTIVIYCAITAVVVCVISITIMLLINKNMNKKQNITPTDN